MNINSAVVERSSLEITKNAHFTFIALELFNGSRHIFFLLVAPCSMWDLSFLTRDQAHAPAVEAWGLNHWTIRGFPGTISENG